MATVGIVAVALLVMAILFAIIYFSSRKSKSDETGRGGPIVGQGPATPRRTQGEND